MRERARRDLNPDPPAPEASALSWLGDGPSTGFLFLKRLIILLHSSSLFILRVNNTVLRYLVVLYEIVFYGRGGQGAVTASHILVQATIYENKYGQGFPFWCGEERCACNSVC